MRNRIQEQESKVDAGITATQGMLESLKQSNHSAWILAITGVIALITLIALVVLC